MSEGILARFHVAESLNPLRTVIHISIVSYSSKNTLSRFSEMLKVNSEYMKKMLSLKVGIAMLTLKP